MAKIYIDRPNEIFHRGTPYQIYINDKKVGTVGSGESKYFEVGQGEHTVVSKMNFFMGSSIVPVTVKGNEVMKLKVNGIRGVLWFLAISVVVFGLIYLSDVVPYLNEYSYIIYPGLYLLYFLLIGRTKHLTLTLEELKLL